MRAHFLRHGQTDYNRRGLCNSDPAVPVHLNATGISEAEQAAERLRGLALERIIVSELPRTRETAEIVNRHHGVPITVHPAINDIRTGCEGRASVLHLRAIAHDPLHASLPGGESLAEHRARVARFLAWLRARPEQTVLIVAHEETLRAVSAELRGLTLEAMRALRFDNGALIAFDLRAPHATGTDR